MKKQLQAILLVLLYQSSLFAVCKKRTITSTTTVDHAITVFVHGTFPARKLLQYSVGKFLTYCPQGLSLARNLPSWYHFHKLAQGCVELNPERYCLDQFYLFGWNSEHVYDRVRMQAACDLIQQVRKIIDDYYVEHGFIPKLRLLGFSHGGNVILYTANYLPLVVNGQSVDVEIWLFGTPIQKINKHLINSHHFLKAYSFYSTKDWMQRMDPQGLRSAKLDFKNIWSDRTFDATDRCIQVEFTVNGRPISHVYYRSILKYFPIIERQIQEKTQEMSCGHIKLNLIKK